MYKIAEINPIKLQGKFVIYYDDKTDVNPYRLYREWNELGPYGLRKRKKQIEKYANLFSCSCVIHEFIQRNDEDGR